MSLGIIYVRPIKDAKSQLKVSPRYGGDSCRSGEKPELAGEKSSEEGKDFATGSGRSGGEDQGNSGGVKSAS